MLGGQRVKQEDIANMISAGWTEVVQSSTALRLKGLFKNMTLRLAGLLCYMELNVGNDEMRRIKSTCWRDAHTKSYI